MTGQAEDLVEAEPRWRLNAVRALAIVLLLLALLPESSSTPVSQVETPSSGQIASSTNGSSSAEVPVTAADTAEQEIDRPLIINRLWSPAANTARVEGIVGPGGPSQAMVIVDGATLQTIELETDAAGRFGTTIDGLRPGPQTLCLDEVCERVLVAEPAIESSSETESRIRQATEQAMVYFDAAAHLPGWTFESAGQNSDAGGYTTPETQTIFISANPNRSTEELTLTVLHEIGHAVDATWMDDNKRDAFRLLRSHDPSLQWGETDLTVQGDDRWLNSAEDFAEVFVAWALDGDYAIASEAVADQPTSADLMAFCELLAFTTDC